jgi:isopentenyldiphosphate isomerase
MVRIPIVNEQDEIICYKERSEVQKEDIYRVSALWITDESKRVLLARRAYTKPRHGGRWGPAVAGTVEEGETYESNIIKETGEELGLWKTSPVFYSKLRIRGENNFFTSWYKLTVDSSIKFVLKEDEVAEILWWERMVLRERFKHHPEEFVPSASQWMEKF